MSRSAEATDWDVRVDDGTVVVELPAGIELDGGTGAAINEQFFEAVARPDVDAVLTLLEVEDPLGSGLFEEVKRGADRAVEEGIRRWGIVVERRVKGMAFESKLDTLDTDVFTDERAAREWIAER